MTWQEVNAVGHSLNPMVSPKGKGLVREMLRITVERHLFQLDEYSGECRKAA